ncbi:MAG: T9SS C-terminal target domain-containing protein [Calditrichaeota bacterium]|nr:MAG: T9SS C-terminal target domain-containing protein [Calditrichota bacterium]
MRKKQFLRRIFLFLVSILATTAAAADSTAAGQADLTSSNLPLVIIDTNGKSIANDPKITAHMKIINNGAGKLNYITDPPTDYDGLIGIEVRGHHSSGFPQFLYDLTTPTETGENLNVSLLGYPQENDWILLSSYNEKSFARTTLSFDLFRSMGHYAPRAQLCEVILNSAYQGVYVFTEQIKQDKNRVNIAKLKPTEIAGDSLTGGYILKIDYHGSDDSWQSAYHPLGHPEQRVYFVYYEPNPAEITTEQKRYIKAFVESAQRVLYSDNFADPSAGYRNYFDIDSFIDYFILSEVARNVDAYKKSRFFSKDRDSRGGLLRAGPVWDFDWAWKNITEGIYANTDGSGWSYTINDYRPDVYPPGWYYRLLQDGKFTNQLIDRYFELRAGRLSLDFMNNYIDSVRTIVADAQVRHFKLWPINQTNPAPEVEPPSRSYDEEIAKYKVWIRRRITWLDANMPKLRQKITVNAEESPQPSPTTFRLFPNPAADRLYIESGKPMRRVQIYNVLGRLVYDERLNDSFSEKIAVQTLQSGIYFIRLQQADGEVAGFEQVITR